MAPTSPPLTGASIIADPSSAARAARRRATAGAIVLQSTIRLPGASAPNTPSAPSSTASTSGESGTIVTMMAA